MKDKKILGLRLGDLAVLLLVCGLVVLMVKHFKHEDEWRTIKVRVSGQKGWFVHPPYWMGEAIGVGMVERGTDGEKLAEITRVENYQRGNEYQDLYVTVNVKGVQDKTSGIFSFKSRPLQVGKEVEFEFPQVYFSGIVIADEDDLSEVTSQWFRVRMKWKDVYPWEANALEEGMEMRGDSRGEYVAKILDVASQWADRSVETDRGTVVAGRDPRKRDVVIDMELSADEYGDGYYFAGHQKFKVGEMIWIYFPEVDVEKVLVMDVEKIEK